MPSTAPRPPSPSSNASVLVGPLILAATLFVAVICASVTILWLLGEMDDPGGWTVVLGLAAIAATIVSAYADNTWSARVTRTTELGNATRLFAVASLLLLIPTVILQVLDEEDEDPALQARGIAAACPDDQVPDTDFDDLEPGSDQQLLASCLQWWGVLSPDAMVFGGSDTVLRGEMAVLLDRLVAAGGAPLPDAPGVPVPDPASPDAGAIARVAQAGILAVGDPAAFATGDPITRGGLSTTIARSHRHVTGEDLPPPEEEHFTDLSLQADADNIEAVAEAGIAVGAADGTFRAGQPVNRSQVALVLARTLDLWVTEGVTELPA